MITIAAGMMMAALFQDRLETEPRPKLQERIAEIERRMQAEPEHLKELLAERDRLMMELKRGPMPPPGAPPIITLDPVRSYSQVLQPQQDQFAVRRVELANRVAELTKMVETLRVAGGAQEKVTEALKTLAECQRQLETLDAQQKYVITRGIGDERATWLVQYDPDVDALEKQSRLLGDEIRRTPATEGAKRDELKKKLSSTLEELFERREKGRWKEMEELETRMKEMRKTLETRKQNKGAIVEKRAKELAGEKSEMDW